MPWISLCTGREEERGCLQPDTSARSRPDVTDGQRSRATAGRMHRPAVRWRSNRRNAQASNATAQQPAERTSQQCDGAAAGGMHKPERDSRRRTQRPADDGSAGRSSTVRIESHTHYRQNSMLALRNCNLKIHLSGAMLPRYNTITFGTVHRPSFPTPNATPTRSGPPTFTDTP